MTWLTGPSVLLVLVLCLSSALDKENIEVLYPQRTITVSKGSSVKLSCIAIYNHEQCSPVHVAWSQNGGIKLTDPNKYVTTVNETVFDGNMRRRQVETEILDLTTNDTGEFQCKAKCDNGEVAMGHFIRVSLKG
ncbi:uncharacterized protein [Paralichthys olivaceus]|uniref:uncharacterized protein n=1 Tax=Paralichthys olivaceus TaxID=8255 RepID=UPI00375231C9